MHENQVFADGILNVETDNRQQIHSAVTSLCNFFRNTCFIYNGKRFISTKFNGLFIFPMEHVLNDPITQSVMHKKKIKVS